MRPERSAVGQTKIRSEQFRFTKHSNSVKNCMVYSVELSSGIAAMPKSNVRAKRGIDKTAILEAAFEMLSEGGEVAFSVRKLGQAIGVDPMTVLHYFGTKDALLRCVADHALTTVALPKPSSNWQDDLRKVARSYRDLARRHPRVFHLHFRFHATGPVDHASSEVVYRAMRSAGLSDADAAGLGLAFYAFVLGFALAEAEGLLRPITKDDERELSALDPQDCAATLALVPAFKILNRDAAFVAAINAFISGVAIHKVSAASTPTQRKVVSADNRNVRAKRLEAG
jgi:AcrR family transcriptional regulator